MCQNKTTSIVCVDKRQWLGPYTFQPTEFSLLKCFTSLKGYCLTSPAHLQSKHKVWCDISGHDGNNTLLYSTHGTISCSLFQCQCFSTGHFQHIGSLIMSIALKLIEITISYCSQFTMKGSRI